MIGAMQIREANTEDAVEACRILRRSITELCRLDHEDNPSVLERWLSNKTPDNVRAWIVHPDNYVAVATGDTEIVGVGAITSTGEITLNYVSPNARFTGVSKAILRRLEAKALELGNSTCALASTKTAQRFYLSAGYEQQGLPTVMGVLTSYRMAKQLAPGG